MTNEPAEQFLQRFHTGEPRATPRSMSWGRTADGRSSYQVLAALVPQGLRRPSLLDLGCGDGHLLAELAGRFPEASLFGVDLCEADLELARAHPALAAATLRQERAQALSLPAASLDYVLCHMALMLMDDLDAVAREIGRVLQPSGCFAAVLPDEAAHTPVFDAFLACFAAVSRAEARPRRVALGDPRAFVADELQKVFTAASPRRRLSLRPFSLRLEGDFAQVWSCLSLTYLLPLLSAEGQKALRSQFEESTQGLADARGVLPFELGLQLLEWHPAAES